MSGKVSLHIEPKERLSFGQDIGCAWYLRTSASHKSKAGLKTGCNHRPPQGRRYLPQGRRYRPQGSRYQLRQMQLVRNTRVDSFSHQTVADILLVTEKRSSTNVSELILPFLNRSKRLSTAKRMRKGTY